MKQHITKDQLKELSSKASEKLLHFCLTHKTQYQNSEDLSLGQLSIGQMIEFLDDYSKKDWKIDTDHHDDPVNCKDHLGYFEYSVTWANDKGQIGFVVENPELTDALWEAVKQILEEK